LAATLSAGAGAASAAPVIEIRNAVAEVIIVPEPRADIEVRVLRSDPRLPLHVSAFMGRTYVDGGLAGRIRGCRGSGEMSSVEVWGVGPVDIAAAAPRIVVRAPEDVKVVARGAVFGRVGYARSLDLVNAGCGAWLVADVNGPLKIVEAGTGDARTGRAGAADLVASGSGSIATGPIAGALKVADVGGGSIEVARVDGPIAVEVAGSGRVRIEGGHASAMQASVQGSGDIDLGGVAGALQASVIGSGEVDVARVTGSVERSVIGSGVVRTGS